MRRVRKDRRPVGALAHVPNLRRDALLRRFTKPARYQTRECVRPSRDRLGTAGRALALLLPRRRVRPVLISGRRKLIGVYLAMSDPRNVAHGKKVAQEKQHEQNKPAAGGKKKSR